MICIAVNVNAYNEIQKKMSPNTITTAAAEAASTAEETKNQTRLYIIRSNAKGIMRMEWKIVAVP